MNISPAEPYIYQPLLPGHIRVLYPTSPPPQPFTAGSEGLTFSLRSILLISDDQDVEYDAVSYAWGDPSGETYPLICDGGVIQIQRNLHDALPYLMRRPSNRPLWIDALCINQKDRIEKLVQIRLMSDVYKRATKVWIWLKAVAPEDLDAAEEAVGYISRIGHAAFDPDQLEGATFTTEELNLPPAASPAWNIIMDLVGAPWFTRLWIIQELTLAKTAAFLFGDHVIASDDLKATILVLEKPGQVLDTEGNKLGSDFYSTASSIAPFFCRDHYVGAYRDSFFAAGAFAFLTIVQRCYDPRDRVFALLGLFEREELSKFRIDHEASLPELYAGFVWFLLSNNSETALWRLMFWFAIDAGNIDSSFPSWCPDFQSLHERGSLSTSRTGIFGPRPASESQISRKIGRTWRELVLRGCIFDTVQEIGDRVPGRFIKTIAGNVTWWVQAQKWERQAAEMISQPETPKSVETASLPRIPRLSLCEYIHFLFDYTLEEGSDPMKLDEFLRLRALLDELASIVQEFGLDK